MVEVRQLRALVFDVDGTLYPKFPLRRAMLFKLAKEAICRPSSSLPTFRALVAYREAQELLRESQVVGEIGGAQLRLACELSCQSEEFLRSVVARWMEREPLFVLERFVSPTLRALLTAARSRSIRLGVFSDYPAAEKLRAMRLAEFFDVTVTAQDPAVNCFKPNPRGLIETLRRLDSHTNEALYIGDRLEVDGRAAGAAGMRCVLVGGPPRNETADCIYVRDYGALQAMLFSTTVQVPDDDVRTR